MNLSVVLFNPKIPPTALSFGYFSVLIPLSRDLSVGSVDRGALGNIAYETCLVKIGSEQMGLLLWQM